ncbi:MAG TPA: Smr/MutS family protein [Rhizomicrobium sp.]
MSRRRTTDEERELFRAVLAGKTLPKPLRPQPKAARAKAVEKKAPAVLTGVDGGTGERLRRGAIVPDSKLDLHGLTESAAYRALTFFLQAAHKRGDRLVLVVTGKGAPAASEPFALEPRSRGVLKTMVPRWLGEPQFARLIADMRGAHRRHGGEGALYLYLRKPKA